MCVVGVVHFRHDAYCGIEIRDLVWLWPIVGSFVMQCFGIREIGVMMHIMVLEAWRV